MGASGSGKSTLLAIAGGMETPTSGAARVAGVDLASQDPNERAAMRRTTIGYIFQDFNLLTALTALDNVAMPLELDGMSARNARKAAMDALERVSMASHAHQLPDVLSGGERQRVAIARAVVGSRRLVLADEPTGALDEDNGAAIMAELRTLANRDAAVLLVTHDSAIAGTADRTVRIADGRIQPDDITPVRAEYPR